MSEEQVRLLNSGPEMTTDLGDKRLEVTADTLAADPSEVVDFITALISRFSEQGGFSTHLPDILESVGQFLNTQRITMSFDEGASCREISWVNNLVSDQETPQEFYFGLKKSGHNNTIFFFDSNTGKPRQSLYLLIATLIDSQLAAEQMIRTEHSQRLLAESINQISKILTSTLDRDELLSLFLNQLETRNSQARRIFPKFHSFPTRPS
ncbi:MAG: hypothetical protein M1281_20670 [Chloroflexi bacterium]|nr:hypothetical protein [Chloroflexota bacterium]